MTVKERLTEFLKSENLSQQDFQHKVGLSHGYVNNMGNSIQPKKARAIAEAFPHLNMQWLIAGEGEMLKGGASGPGAPYYDVDFIGGFDEILNDQTIVPNFTISYLPLNKVDLWINITGDSMAPMINGGDVVALQRVENWQDFILFNEVYAVVTDDFRTIKTVRRGKDDEHFLLSPVNPSHQEQQIPKKLITHLFKVRGAIRKFF